MIVKSCYIDGFGNFSDTEFDFEDGLNVLNEVNGWGKSTLAAFIKSMFSGMEISRRKKLTEYRRYEPWQGGKYGGSLTFEVGEKQYKVIRYFGKKDALFELYNSRTNKPSTDYSENLGEELFGIDRESFERSIFIKLDTEQKEPALSDSISAKLNNLIDNTDDINNFETAYKRLDALASSIVPKRGKGGETGRIEEEISELKSELFRCDSAAREAQQLRTKISRDNEKKQELESKLAEIKTDIYMLDLAGKKKRYERLISIEDEQRRRLNALKAFFENGLPDVSEVDRRVSEAKELDIYASRMAELPDAEEKRAELAEADRFFNGAVPTEDDIAACRENIIGYGVARERLAKYELTDEEIQTLKDIRARYGGMPSAEPADECAAAYERSVELGEKINEKREEQRRREAERSAAAARSRSLFIGAAAVAAAACAAAAILMEQVPAKAAFAVLAVIAAVAALARLIVRSKAADGEPQEELDRLIAERGRLMKKCVDGIRSILPDADTSSPMEVLSRIREDAAEVRGIERKRARYEEERKSGEAGECRSRIESFLGRYAFADGETDFSRRLSAVQNRLNLRTRLLKELDAYDRASAAYEKTEASLGRFLAAYAAKGDSAFEKVQYIRDMLIDYKDAEEELTAAKNELDEFRENHDISLFKDITPPEKTMAELDEESRSCRGELDELLGAIARAERDIEKQADIADRREELEAERVRKQERADYLVRKHGILRDTMSLLAQAKEDIDAQYMKDMVPAFDKYVSMIEPGQNKLALTAELGTQIISGGRHWESGYQSRGYSDMTNICTRLALAEVMYKGEKPFIILDDPFVNLDDEKTKLALEFLKELAKERQIFYFTCHSSRSI